MFYYIGYILIIYLIDTYFIKLFDIYTYIFVIIRSYTLMLFFLDLIKLLLHNMY